ncbi:hypothetical protein LCGC14_3076220, partial [marine sediment metagenome]
MPILERILVMQDAATGTGNGTVLMCEGYAFASFQLSGTFSATIKFEVTVDEENWIEVQAKNENDGSISTTATAEGIYSFYVAGYARVRARISLYGSGSVTVTAKGTYLAPGVALNDVELSVGDVNIGDVDIVPRTDFEGSPVTVGTTAVELTFNGDTTIVFIQSD